LQFIIKSEFLKFVLNESDMVKSLADDKGHENIIEKFKM